MKKPAPPVRVIGCPHGLAEDPPHYPSQACETPCLWRISRREARYCSWVLFLQLKLEENSMTLRETGAILGLSHESIRNIETNAMEKLRESIAYCEAGVLPENLATLPCHLRFTSSSIEKSWRKDNGYPDEDL